MMERRRADRSTLLRRRLPWGIADQILSSGTNLALAIVAGRVLGPSGLGVIFIGFTAATTLVLIQRALLADPLIVRSANESLAEREAATTSALTTAITVGCAGGAACFAMALLLPDPFGQGLLVVSPWILPLCVQDFWRSVLFRDGRGSSAAANDAAWAVVMIAAGIATLGSGTVWLVMGIWGLGGAVGALLGFRQTRIRPGRVTGSLRWWRAACWPLGRWFLADRVALNLGTQGVVFLAAGLVGQSSLGGYRAAQSVFAPITLLGPAVALPGLPAITLASGRSWSDGFRLASWTSVATVTLVSAYLGMIVALGASTGQGPLATIYGTRFARYDDLLLPIAIAQLAFAIGLGFDLLLRALGRGRSLTASRMVGSIALIVSAVILGRLYGIDGIAWSVAVGAGVGTAGLVLAVLSTRVRVHPEDDPADRTTHAIAG